MKKWWLAGIIILGFLLRVSFLDKFPPGFTPDEASFGYDAYSIIHTGRDQWGKILPILFESFGDFKSPLYGYLAIPSVFIFGLSTFAVRLPSAIFGTLAILATYLLVKELFKKEKLALISSLMLAISPWHLQLSRGAFEANLTTFFLPFAVFLFLKGLKKPKFLVFSSLVFGLNLFTYHSAKLITPIILIALVLLYKKISPRFFLIFSIFLGLTIYSFYLGAGRRAADINIYNGSLIQAFEERTRSINSGTNPVVAHIIYNKYFVTTKRFYINYTSYFSSKFLFIKGPAEGTYGMIPGVGVLYMIESIFLLTFTYTSIRLKVKENYFILFWILISPIPASLTSGVGYAANRVAVMMPAIQIASALGFIMILHNISRIRFKFKYLLNFLIITIFIFESVLFLRKYFMSSEVQIGRQMLSGNLEAVDYVSKNYSGKKILISTGLSEPHIYWAFATKTNPKSYQEATKSWDYKSRNLSFMDQLPEYKLDGIIFKRIDWKLDPKNFDVIVGRPDEFPKGIVITNIFYYPDGSPALYAETN